MILHDKPTYSFAEAAIYLQISETSLHDLIESGVLAAAKVGKSYVLRKVVLDDYLMMLEAEQTAQRREAFLAGCKPHVATAVSLVRGKRKALPKLPDLKAA